MDGDRTGRKQAKRLLSVVIALFGIGAALVGCSATTTSGSPLPTTSAPVFSDWRVGATPLPLQPDGYGEIEPTPAALVNRRLPTTDFLPPPTDGGFHSTSAPVPAAVLARSTWQAGCPVTKAAQRYLTMSFWGFDDKPHTGEMIVNAQVASAVPKVFAQLFAEHFPIEEMRVASVTEATARPTGDGNNTTAFVCRPAVGQTTWSAHAYGLAIDVNPFCNPYREGDLIVPELSSSYLNRADVRPGMVLPGDATIRAFASVGWTWGGSWTSPKDLMHFTANGH
ncbi:MAG TPA: M15 family metallopeptidase [Pseudonocardiaceae bacterium]